LVPLVRQGRRELLAALGCRVDLETPVWPDRLVNQVLRDKEVNQVYRVLLEVPELQVLSILSSAALEVRQLFLTTFGICCRPSVCRL